MKQRFHLTCFFFCHEISDVKRFTSTTKSRLHTHTPDDVKALCLGDVMPALMKWSFVSQAEECLRLSWTQGAKESPLHQEYEAVRHQGMQVSPTICMWRYLYILKYIYILVVATEKLCSRPVTLPPPREEFHSSLIVVFGISSLAPVQ